MRNISNLIKLSDKKKQIPDNWDTFCKLSESRFVERRENDEHNTGVEIEYSKRTKKWWWPERW